MLSLFMIADDLTGALDAGVQLSSCCAVQVTVCCDEQRLEALAQGFQALVVDAETRHLSPAKAYEKVERLVRWALSQKVPCIYKKTDSALRGNIGAELSALAQAAQKEVHFIPAYPEMGRVTAGGIHFINGVPAAQSPFGKDPFEPVQTSFLPELIASQTKCPVVLAAPGRKPAQGAAIFVYDSASEEEIEKTAALIAKGGSPLLLAGCAGFAKALPQMLGLQKTQPAERPVFRKLLFVCGSVNPVARTQCEMAALMGTPHFLLSPIQKMNPLFCTEKEGARLLQELLSGFQQSPAQLLDAGREAPSSFGDGMERLRVTACLGGLVKGVLDGGFLGALLVTGGDTLLGLMQALQVQTLVPLCEIAKGVVLCRYFYGGVWRELLSKSGGFGPPGLLCDLARLCGQI